MSDFPVTVTAEPDLTITVEVGSASDFRLTLCTAAGEVVESVDDVHSSAALRARIKRLRKVAQRLSVQDDDLVV